MDCRLSAEELSILVGRMWMVFSLKPLRRLALGKRVERNPSDARYWKAVGGHGEYCEAMHSMQKHDMTYQHTVCTH